MHSPSLRDTPYSNDIRRTIEPSRGCSSSTASRWPPLGCGAAYSIERRSALNAFDKTERLLYSPAPIRAQCPEFISNSEALERYEMTWVEVLFLATYFLVLLVLSIYGSHPYFMAYLYYQFQSKFPT